MSQQQPFYNPWLDIASYTTNDAYRFKGREKATVKFTNIVNNGTMSVLYANSGIGKTSFINAGIDPIMTEKGYVSVHILFPDDVFTQQEKLEQWLINRIIEKTSHIGTWKDTILLNEKRHEVGDSTLLQCESSLWWFLHTKVLINHDTKQVVKLLLVFDQFEEIFVKSRKVFNGSNFLQQLFRVIEELSNSSLPKYVDMMITELAEHEIFIPIDENASYKVIFSLRKEFLSDFDFWTQDRYCIAELQQNRMLLLPLTINQAKRVITEQPKSKEDREYIDTLNGIQDEIIKKLDPHHRNEIEPFLLSVLCSRLYTIAHQSKKNTISSEDLITYSMDSIILSFYEEKISQIITNPRHLMRFETYLVDKDGSRNRIKLKNLSSIHFEKYKDNLLKEHLIRIDTFNSDEEYVELIHDRIADAIVVRRSNTNKEHKRKLKVLASVLLFMTIAILTISVPRATTVKGCTKKHREVDIDTIERAYTAKCDSILMLQNTYVGQSAFNTNPHVKTIHVKSNVTLSQTCFANCPNLTTVIFDGKNINLGDDVFYCCNSLHSIEITNSAYFGYFGTQSNAPKSLNFIVAQNNSQCEVDVLGNVLRIDDVIWARNTNEYLSRYYLPKEWECLIHPTYKGRHNIKWCDTITFKQIECNDYNTNNKYYLIDTISTIPVLDYAAQNFLKNNVLYACLPNIRVINSNLFEYSELQRIDIYNATHIQDSAFYSSKLHHIESPNIKIVDDYAFASARNLPKNIRWDSLEQIGNYVFKGISANSIEFPNLKVANEKSFTGLEFATLILPHSLFYNQDTLCQIEGQDFSSTYGIDTIEFKISPSIGTPYNVIKKATNKEYFILSNIDSSIDLQGRFSTLKIGKDVHYIPNITGINKLENIHVDFRNTTYFSYRNILYRKDGISYDRVLVAPNQPRVFIYNYGYGDVNVGDNTKEIILLDAFQYTKLTSINEQKKNITVFFPYGSENYIRQLSKTDLLSDYKDVKEMSYFKTAYYNFSFRVVMNFHYNYWIFISLLVFFILLLIAPIRRLKLSNSKIIFSIVYTFLSLTGCFFIISSRLLIDKIPTIQFLLVFLWFDIASRVAEWTASPKYSFLLIAKDISGTILIVSFVMSAAMLYYQDLLDINIWSWVIVFSILAVISTIALIFINKQKVIYDKYATTHLARRLWFALECYMYLAMSLGVILSIHLEDSKIMAVNAFAMLVAVTIVIGFIIAHWNIGRETGFAYSKYMKLRNQLKSQQLMTFNSDSILIKRMRMGILFDGIAAALIFILLPLSEYLWTENLVVPTIILGVLLLLPIIMHICFKYKTISYSDLIKQYQIEYQELLSAKQNLPPELQQLEI